MTDHLQEVSPFCRVRLKGHLHLESVLANPQPHRVQNIPLLQRLSDSAPRKMLCNRIWSPSMLSNPSMTSWRTSETNDFRNREQSHDSLPHSGSIQIEKNLRKRRLSPNTSLRSNPLSNSLMRWLNVDFMLPSDLEVNPLPNFQTLDKPLTPKRQYRQQEHCKAKKQKLSFDPLPFINNESKDMNQAPLVMKKNLLERMMSPESHLNKKIRIFEKDMPWYHRELTAHQSANPSCTKTHEILSNFAKDYSAVKHWIIIAHSAPCGFPPVEWENIIKGKPVSLDNILSSLHHISPIKENVGHAGSTEISLGRTEPTRKVKTSGEWTSAWNATIKVTTFAFPHREDELREYGDYMDQEFSSKVVSAHRKLILYDEAVRAEVGGGQRILLTDRSHFSYIYSTIVLPDGIKSQFGKGTTFTNSYAGKSQPDICRHFNSTAKCPNSSSTCYYRHICSKCKQPGHSKPDCESREGKTSQKSSS